MSRPTSTFNRNSMPISSMISRRFSTTSFSNLNGGVPKVSKPVLRTNGGGHFRQGIGLMRKFRRLEQFPFVDEVQPIGNVVVHRTFPFAKRIAAGNAASGLLRRRLGAVLRINFAKLAGTHLDGQLVRILARNIEELQMLVGHKGNSRDGAAYAARRRFSSSESMAEAFGLTTQNLPM